MPADALRADVLTLAARAGAVLGLVVVDLSLRPGRDALHVQVLADRPSGGIGIDECAALNRALDRDLETLLGEGTPYTLEVASPGLDRPLRTPADFRRVMGQDVHLFFCVAGRRELCGRVLGVRDEDMVLQTDAGETTVLFADLDKGLLII